MSDPSIRPSPIPAGPVADDAAKDPTYRPLCLLAVVGAGVGGLYAVVVVLGGLIALLRGDPWLLPGWTILFPVAGAVLSFLGMQRIQRSEGTLAGEKVARWGLLLSLLIGLSYWGYVGATYFAISQESDRFARRFMDELAKGQVYPAFRLTLPPAERPAEGAGLRAQLETRFNNVADPVRRGNVTYFTQSDLVRLLSQGGPETKIESLGVEDWKYAAGGYQVQMLYRVTTPLVSGDAIVLAQSKEGKGSEGRQWHIVVGRTGMKAASTPEITSEGRRRFEVASQARDAVNRDWAKTLHEGNVEEAFLATLPPAERARPRVAVDVTRAGLLLAAADGPCAAPTTALTLAALGDDRVRSAATPGLENFLAGGLVRAPKDLFWAPEETKEDIINRARQLFRHPDAALVQMLTPPPNIRYPLVRREGDRFVVELDVGLRLPAERPRYMADALLVAECPEADTATSKAWRIRSLDLVSGKTLPEQMAGMPPPP